MTNEALEAYTPKPCDDGNDETDEKCVIGHYTQVVWADTAEVGCGYMTSDKNGSIESVRKLYFQFHILVLIVHFIYLSQISYKNQYHVNV